MKKEIVVIVDAYSSGKYIAPEVKKYGYECIHIQSEDEVMEDFQKAYVASNFTKNIKYHGCIYSIINQLSGYHVLAVIPGTETGIILADILANNLTNKANPISLSEARRDKYKMQKALQDFGVEQTSFCKFSNLEASLKYANKIKYPVVVKALSSAASYHVYLCDHQDELIKAYSNIIGKKNIFGNLNTEVLIQKFISGQEYIVNTVSSNGCMKVTDIWKKYKKNINGRPINLYSVLIDFQCDEYDILVNYTESVLKALQINNGAAHTEIILEEDLSPKLIETGARLAGTIDPTAVTLACGTNQVTELVKSYLNEEDFFCDISNKVLPQKSIMHIFLLSNIKGIIKELPNKYFWNKVDNLHSIYLKLKNGCEILKTTSLADIPGYAYIMSGKNQSLWNNYLQFRATEKSFYQEIKLH